MGTETIFPIGTVLNRRKPKNDVWDEIKVVGGGDHLVVTSNKEFSESKTMDVMTAREEYDGDIPENEGSGEEYSVTIVNPGLSPEQIFAKQAREAAARGETPPKAREGRKRSDPPAPTREGGE